jgi:phage baseplate assembly protein W
MPNVPAIDPGSIFGRGMQFPPRVGPDGRILWSEGAANVREAIDIILMTRFNERINLPDFGGNLGTFLFEPNTVTTRHLIETEIVRALRRWEPRITIESVDVQPDPLDPLAAIATVTYRLVASQAVEQVGVTVTLGS